MQPRNSTQTSDGFGKDPIINSINVFNAMIWLSLSGFLIIYRITPYDPMTNRRHIVGFDIMFLWSIGWKDEFQRKAKRNWLILMYFLSFEGSEEDTLDSVNDSTSIQDELPKKSGNDFRENIQKVLENRKHLSVDRIEPGKDLVEYVPGLYRLLDLCNDEGSNGLGRPLYTWFVKLNWLKGCCYR